MSTPTMVPACCVACHAAGSGIEDLGRYAPYWLCRDTKACWARVWEARLAARAAEDSAPGTATETDPDVPPSGETQGNAVPGAEHDEPEATQEAEPLEPLPEPADATDKPAEDEGAGQ